MLPGAKRPRSSSTMSDSSSCGDAKRISRSTSLEPNSTSLASSVTQPPPDAQELPQHVEGDFSAHLHLNGAASPSIAIPPRSDVALPEPMAQYDMIKPLMEQQMELGQTWFIVAKDWYAKWEAVCAGVSLDKRFADITPDQIGPIDNTRIAGPLTGELTAEFSEVTTALFMPAEPWHLLVSWYGSVGVAVERQTIKPFANNNQIQLECNLPVANLYPVVTATLVSVPKTIIQFSRADTIASIKSKARSIMQITETRPVRLWSLTAVPTNAICVQSYDLEHAGQLVTDIATVTEDMTAVEATIDTVSDFAIEAQNEDGSWLYKEPAIIIPSPPPFGGPSYLDDLSSRQNAAASSSNATAIGPMRPGRVASAATMDKFKHSTTAIGPARPARRASLTSTDRPATRSSSKGKGRGLIGLQNLGNTCFMNSALQCLSNTPELQVYFNSGRYKSEINRDNPLGMNGEIAYVFGQLIERMWSGQSSAISPREFKQTLSKFAPAFSGWQQHDSQELLAFLLDGLHEDLNRIINKPYDEVPDWQGGGDQELMQLAHKSWEIYKRRNDSVIVDLFQGQYRSTVVCPECEKVSITFDPFMYVTLALPISRTKEFEFFFVPKDQSKPHVAIKRRWPATATFKQIKGIIGQLIGVDPKTLYVLERYKKIYWKYFGDSDLIAEVSSSDDILFYELPYQYTQSQYYGKANAPDPDHIIVNLYFSTDERPTDAVAQCTVLALTREQASSYATIEKLVYEAMTRWEGVGDKLYVPPPPPENENETSMSMVIDQPKTFIPSLFQLFVSKRIAPPHTWQKSCVQPELVHVLERHEKMKSPPEEKDTVMPGGFETPQEDDLYQDEKEKPKVNGDAIQTDTPLLQNGEVLVCAIDSDEAKMLFRDIKGPATEDVEIFKDPEGETQSIKKKQDITIQDCLNEFTKEEKLSEDNTWYCPQCKKHQEATKKVDLWKVPDILVVHFKRFSNNRAFRDKIDAFVDFPVEGLDLSQMVEGRKCAERLKAEGAPEELLIGENLDEPLVYDLYGIDNHMGGLGGGHYTAAAKSIDDDKWHYFDDSWVRDISPENAKSSSAYLLFYRRRTSQAIGGKYLADDLEQQKKALEEEKALRGADAPEEAGDSVFQEPPNSSITSLPSPAESYSHPYPNFSSDPNNDNDRRRGFGYRRTLTGLHTPDSLRSDGLDGAFEDNSSLHNEDGDQVSNWSLSPRHSPYTHSPVIFSELGSAPFYSGRHDNLDEDYDMFDNRGPPPLDADHSISVMDDTFTSGYSSIRDDSQAVEIRLDDNEDPIPSV